MINQVINIPFPNNITLTIKRDDLNHKFISGNKLRKLKYNLIEAINQNKTTLISFGGAFSNHIAALAYAGMSKNMKTIGVIRGNECFEYIDQNPTLSFAKKCGMQFHFVNREDYRRKKDEDFIAELKNIFGDFYYVPEGGTNNLAIKGCEEILEETDNEFDYICCAIGTGGTISGIINSSKDNQTVIGFPALKGDFIDNQLAPYITKNNYILMDYHFEGFGKVNDELINFMNYFYSKTEIPLDPIYTGKMIYGIFDLINKDFFKPNSKILAIHTGGLQGIEGMNYMQKKKNAVEINYSSGISPDCIK